jgi:hypothetical protein
LGIVAICGGSAVGSTASVLVRLGFTLDNRAYWLETFFALVERCAFVRCDLFCVTYFFETDFVAPRNTNTPPVRSLTGTISCAATNETNIIAAKKVVRLIGKR